MNTPSTFVRISSIFFFLSLLLSSPSFGADAKLDSLVSSISGSVDKMVDGLKRIDAASPAGKKPSSQSASQIGAGSVADGGGGFCGVGADTVATNFRDSGVLKELQDSKGELKEIVSKDGKKISELGEQFKSKKMGRPQFKANFLDPVNEQVKSSLYDVIYKEAKAAALLKGVNQGSAAGKLFFANFYRKWKFGGIPDPAAVESYSKEANSSLSQYNTIKTHLCSPEFTTKPVCKKACEGFTNFHAELKKIVADKFPELRAAMKEQVAMAEKQEAVLVGTQDVPVTTAGGPIDAAKAGAEQPAASGVSETPKGQNPTSDLAGTSTSGEKKVEGASPENSGDLTPAPRPVVSANDKKESPNAAAAAAALKLQRDQPTTNGAPEVVADEGEPALMQSAKATLPMEDSEAPHISSSYAPMPLEETAVTPEEPIVGEAVGDTANWGVAQEGKTLKDPSGNEIVPIFPTTESDGGVIVAEPQQTVRLSRETFANDEILKRNDIDLYSDHDSRILQQTINQVYEQNNGVGVTVDGVAGSKTLSAYQNIMNDPKLKAQFEDAWRKQGMYVPRAPASATASK